MKTFKKIITLALVLSMLATLFVPMSVNAASATKTWTKTSELWAEQSNSELSAVKTTAAPTIDGVKDAMWDNAQPLVMNSATKQTYNMPNSSFTAEADIYMLYDNTNLYILYDVKSGTVDLTNILPEREYEAKTLADAQAGTKKFDGYMPKFSLNGDSADAAKDAVVTNRRFVFLDNNFTNANASKESGWAASDATVGSRIGDAATNDLMYAKYKGVAGKYVMEIVIPWKAIQCDGPTPFGIKFAGTSYHCSPNGATSDGAWYGRNINQDCAWQDPVALKDAKGAVPAYITAAANSTLKTSWSKTSELFAHDSSTDLGAIKTATAPTIDGTKDSVWDNAHPLVLNNFTARTISNAYFGKNQNAKFYMLYDNNNLYVLAEVGAATVNKITLNIVPDKNYVAKTKADATAGTADWDGFMPDFQVQDADQTSATPKITERNFVYKDNTLAATNGDKTTRTGDVASTTAITAKYNGGKTNGWTMEIAIPWSYLDCATPTDFGIKVTTSGFHINVAENYKWQNAKTMNHDCAYLDPVELRDAKGDKPAYLVEAEAIEAAYTKFAADIVNPEITEFEIGTKAELLAFDIYDYLAGKDRERGETMYSGKTFKLTADIDLNPGVDWATYTPDKAHWGVYTGKAPATTWTSIGDFAGIIDGQGHKISGLYNNGYAMFVYGGGFMGELYNDTGVAHGIKNLIIENGYMIAKNNDCNGALVGSVRTCGSFLENIYIGENFTWEAKNLGANWGGGLVGRAHDYNVRGADELDTITIKNCVYAGKIIYSATASSGSEYQNALIGQTNLNEDTRCLITDCVFTGEVWNNLVKVETPKAVGDASANKAYPATMTRVYATSEAAAADTANAIYFTTMANGDVLPVVVGDMVIGLYCQSNDNTNTTVRLVTEISSRDWTSFGYKITVVRASDGKVATFDDTANTKVYNAVTAGGVQVGYEAEPFADMNGAALYAVELKGINTADTYTVTVVPVWTYNTTVIEGATHSFTLPVAAN